VLGTPPSVAGKLVPALSVAIRTCTRPPVGATIGEDKANMSRRPDVTADHPLTQKQLAELRGKLSQMSVTAVRDFYHAAWIRCGLERKGGRPRASAIQELVQAWKEMRRVLC